MPFPLWSRLTGPRRPRPHAGRRGAAGRCRPGLERLEGRLVPAHAPDAAVVFVDDGNFSGVEDGTAENPFNTIQEGVDHANPGDTVRVAPGLYVETVTVNKAVTLQGAQAGVDPNGRFVSPATESIVSGPAGSFRLQANNVVLDGFVVQGTVLGTAGGAGVFTSPQFAGYQVRFNIIQDNIVGLSLGGSGLSATVVERNVIRDNDNPGTGSGTGILADGGLAGAVIQHNTITGAHAAAGVLLAGQANPVSNVTLRGNTFSAGNQLFLTGAASSLVIENAFSGTLPPGGTTGPAVVVGGGADGLTVQTNTFAGRPERAVLVTTGAGLAANTNLAITDNSVTLDVSTLTAGLAVIDVGELGGGSHISCNLVDLSGTLAPGVTAVHGIDVTGPVSGTLAVAGNTLLGLGTGAQPATENTGVRLPATLGGAADVRVLGNAVNDWEFGIDSDAAAGLAVNYNSFAGNAVALRHTGAGNVNAEVNYWGSPTGPTYPNFPPGAGQIVEDPNLRVDVFPFATTIDVTARARFVFSLYVDVLERVPDQGGYDGWVQFLQQGGNRAAVVDAFWFSAEHRGVQVDRIYQAFFRRAADAAGRAFWVSQFQAGVPEEEVILNFLVSAEYGSANPGNAGFVTALYRDVLGRPPEPTGLTFWVGRLDAGLGRDELARRFLTSQEERMQVVDAYYRGFLNRAPDPGGLASWTQALQSGALTRDSLAVTLLNSEEYFVQC